MSKIDCNHCGLKFDKSSLIEQKDSDKTLYFCCSGCQGVYNLLQSQGLDDFYKKTNHKELSPPKEKLSDSSSFDSPGYIQKYTKKIDNLIEISLIIEGIHCSACVWLNEKVLHSKDGVVEANINFTTHKAKILYDPKLIKLSEVIETIRSIGYDAFAYDAKAQEERTNRQRKEYYYRMAVAIFATMNIMWIAVAQYSGYFSGMKNDLRVYLNIAEWLLSTPVLFYSGWIFIRGAYFGIKNNIVNMDILVSTGALLTYAYSIYITIFTNHEAYFDSVAMIITFVLIGKFLEVLSKKKAIDKLDLLSLQMPFESLIVIGDKKKTIAVDSIQEGDLIELKAGERASADGIVVKGNASFNESNITGESKEVYKDLNSNIVGGTLSVDGWIQYIATKTYANSTMSKLINMLDNTLENKPEIETLTRKISEHFSSAVLILSLFTFIFWYLNNNFETSFIIGISVIIIACPCALALATPLASLVGLGIGIQESILFKESKFLETVAKTDTVVLDKTGTITIGEPHVVNYKKISTYDENLLFSLVSLSSHPISKGIKKYFKNKKIYNTELENIKTIVSKGISSEFNNLKLLGGNNKLMEDFKVEIPKIDSQNTFFYFAINGNLVAIFELTDEIKNGSSELISYLQSENIDVHLLSGDTKEVCEHVVKNTGIKNFKYSLSPFDKLDFISNLQSKNKVVMMVGDGVNDILALAKSNVAISMGSGSEVAVDVGDVILLDDSLLKLKKTFEISKTTFYLIKQNLGISLLYNAITIPLAMMGYIIPLVAAISMSFSSLIVVLNSLRISYKNRKIF